MLKTGPFPCIVKHSLDVFKKITKYLDSFNTDKINFMKINIESSPPELWIRIRFHNGSGSPSILNRLKSSSKDNKLYGLVLLLRNL